MSGRPILLVHHDHQSVERTRRALVAHDILNPVVHVRDGSEALDRVFGVGPRAVGDTLLLPALIILDAAPPAIDALAVLRALRGDERTRDLQVVVVTSADDQQLLLGSYDLGATTVLRRGTDPGQLSRVIERLDLIPKPGRDPG